MTPDHPDPTAPGAAAGRAFVQRAIASLAKGDARGALGSASEACHAAPYLPQAHYAYGQAWTALGEHARAERAFAAALQLAPTWADAWVNYGVARYRQGEVEDAKTAMRQALINQPGHGSAIGNLAAFMRITGGGEAAEALLRDQLARQPAAIGIRLNLVADLLDEEQSSEALELLEAIPPPDDIAKYQHWRLQQVLALLQLGRLEDARRMLDGLTERGVVSASLLHLVHWRKLLLALAEGDEDWARSEAEAMEATLLQAGDAVLPEHHIMARFDIAKFWARQGAHHRAFGHWAAGHAMLGRSQPFSRAVHHAFVDASIAHCNAARLRDGPRAGNHDPAPVFIVGMPRSGTTLMEQILAAHRDVHGAGERYALYHAFTALGGSHADSSSLQRVAALGQAAFDRAATDYLAALHALNPEKARVVDKMPGNFMYLGLIALLLPGARIIHCVRDPRDIGLSIFTFRFHGVHPYAHDLGDLGWYIGQHDRLMAHWRAALPNPILTVQLADWVDDFDATLARVLAHLDLPPDPNCARFYESDHRVRTVSRAQVRQPVNARGLGRWLPYAADLAPLIAELAACGSLDAWTRIASDPRKD